MNIYASTFKGKGANIKPIKTSQTVNRFIHIFIYGCCDTMEQMRIRQVTVRDVLADLD